MLVFRGTCTKNGPTKGNWSTLQRLLFYYASYLYSVSSCIMQIVFIL